MEHQQTPGRPVTQQPVRPRTDLRDMLRQHLVRRGLECMERARERREQAAAHPEGVRAYVAEIRAAVRGFYGPLPVGAGAPPVNAREVSRFEKPGFRIKNVLFESFPGWEVNATVYVPTRHAPPFPVVVVPVGHSGKQFENYQLPCQYFALAGYVAVCFDPPGQSSEKRPGNDHFVDGVRCYLVGESSSRYFVADALRCVDYAASRPDCDVRRGVAMTGVSGGGTSTTLAGILDERVRVLGPSCCLTELADLDITQCYAGCPETHMFGRYSEGVDELDLICAALPRAVLLMAGEEDEVFHIADTRRLAEQAAEFFRAGGHPDRFAFFTDTGRGHCYSLTQAREFTRFMNRWLLGEPGRPCVEWENGGTGEWETESPPLSLLPYEELRCRPRTDVNMRTLSAARARRLAEGWDQRPEAIRRAAAQVAGARGPATPAEVEEGEPFQVWVHHWRSLMLRPEPGIEVPATLLEPAEGAPGPYLLHVDDHGRHRLMERQGPLMAAIRFLERGRRAAGLLAVDVRGWGDTTPALYPYEMAGWGGVDRYLAYTGAALGDPVMAMRIRDCLAALAFLRSRPGVDPERLVLTGAGLGGVVALYAAAIAAGAAGVVAGETPAPVGPHQEAETYSWPQDAFLPNVLLTHDLPLLAGAIPCPVGIFEPLDAQGRALSPADLDALSAAAGRPVYRDGGWPERIREMQGMLGIGDGE